MAENNPTAKVELSVELPAATPVAFDISSFVLENGIRVDRGRNNELERFKTGGATIQLNNNDGRFDPNYNGVLVNLVSNPSIETDTSGYALTAGATIARAGDPTPYGSFDLQVVTQAGTDHSGVVYGNTTLILVTPAVVYTVSVYARLAVQSTKSMNLDISWYTAADALISTSLGQFTLASTAFARFSTTATAPALADHARITIATHGTTEGSFDFRLDALQFEQAAAASTYTDGTQDNCRWAGTVHASRSYRGGPFYPNLRPMNRIWISGVWAAVTYPQIAGYVDGWVPEYPGPNESIVNLRLDDAFAVFAQQNVQMSNPNVATDNLTNLPEERSNDRIERVLDAIGWPAADRVLGNGASVLIEQQELGSTSALSYLQLIEQTENGRFWIRNDGIVRFLSRWDLGQSPYTTSQATFGQTGADLRYVSVTPSYDMTFIRNEVRLTGAAEDAVEQVNDDGTSQGRYYKRTMELSGLLVRDNELAAAANYLVNRYNDVHKRFISLECGGLLDPDNQWPVLLSLELGDRITVKFTAPGPAGEVVQECFIEGIRHDWTRARTLRTTLTLSSFGIGYLIYPAGKGFFTLGTSVLNSSTAVLVY